MIKILFYILSLYLGETGAARLNMDVDQVIALGTIPNDDTIGTYEQWLTEYKDSEVAPYLESLIWPYYHIKTNEELEFKHLRAFLKYCEEEIELFPTSAESSNKLLNLPDSVLQRFQEWLDIPDTPNAMSINKVYLQLLQKLLTDDNLLRELTSSMDSWNEEDEVLEGED